MKTDIILLIISVLLFTYACEKDSITDSNIALISPTEGVIGTSVKMYDNIPLDLTIGSVAIFFSDVDDFVQPDSISEDTIYTYVPFGAQSGDITLYFNTDSVIIKDFQVIEESLDEVKVCWSDLNYLIDEGTSTYSVATVHEEYKWDVEIVQDTVRITAGFYPGDYIVYYHLNLLDKGANQLPQFLSGYGLMETDYGTEINYPLNKGIIKIQDWDIGILISGRVFSIPWNNNNYCFWYEFDGK